MAAASDKARFYLEQYVPELQEYARKEIFTPTEISSITRKRSDFEHTLNARGSAPSDYAKYAMYEMNLSTLVKKRCKRLGIKQGTNFSGQRTVFFILERGTKKFPGDMGLWMQYIQFCQKQKASKKLAKVFTSVLRLKPRDWSLWVLAAKHYAESMGDMATARSYMQRGLRFCKEERRLWCEYLRLEMVYLAKLAARKKILGFEEKQEGVVEKEREIGGEEDADMMMLPSVTAEDIEPDADKGMQEIDSAALQRLASAPAYTGGIPVAIFDAAVKQFKDSAEVAEDLFEIVATFENVPAASKILQHILDSMRAGTSDTTPEVVFCEARLALFGVDALSEDFPGALGECLTKLGQSVKQTPQRRKPARCVYAVLLLLAPARHEADMDEDIMNVVRSKLREYLASTNDTALMSRLRVEGKEEDANLLSRIAGLTDVQMG